MADFLQRPSFTHGKALSFPGTRDEGLHIFGGYYPTPGLRIFGKYYPTPHKEHLGHVGGLRVQGQLIIQHPPLEENTG